MSCKIPDVVLNYIQLIEADTPRANKDQHAFAAYIRRVFDTENIYVDYDQLEHYLGLVKYFPFEKLIPWEECCLCLWMCTYSAPGRPRWKTFFALLGRGAGKDGFIAFISFCAISPYNPVDHYNVDICAFNEEQAMTPLLDLVEVLEIPKNQKKLDRYYYHTKELIQGRKNKGKIKGRTNNPKGRDGMRSGMTIFNEVHTYENYDNIKVFITGQGKVAQPRRGIFSSNGEVSDGPLDDYINQGMRILYEGENDHGFLPLMCRLNSEEEVHDPLNWFMANPSLYYFPHLQQEIEDEYRDWCEHPEQNGDFMTKRMGIRTGCKEVSVTDYDKILATNKMLPDLSGWSCIVGVDYAELSDWAAVNIHFRKGNERYDINHAWICLKSKTLHRIKPNWKKWVEDGLCTAVDDVSISPDLIADYIKEMGKKYNIKKLAMDNFRWTLVSDAMIKIGFDARDKNRVKLVKTTDIMQIEPLIQECFDRGYFWWGNNPCLRWAVNNTKRVRSSKKIGSDTGNFYYAKIEAKSRKTDPFMALVASMTIESELGTGEAPAIPAIGAIAISL